MKYIKLFEEFINEDTFTDFISEFGSKLKTLLKDYKSLSKKFEKWGEEEWNNPQVQKEISRKQNIYDKEVYQIADSLIDGYDYDVREIADEAINMNWRHGTESRFMYYGLEDLLQSYKKISKMKV